MKNLVHSKYKVDEKRIKVLIKGIDLNKYHFSQRSGFKQTINILFVKADFKRGGLFELIDAIIRLKAIDIKLTVIGPPEKSLDSIRKYASDKGLKNFEINGPMRPEKVREFFATADIFCVPSHKEALGVANMEALASGLPVVSTNVGGIPEVLDYGKAGWMVEPGRSDQLAAAIKECIENDSLRIKKSKHGYQHVQQFNSEELIDNFLSIVDEVIDQNEKK
jgi:glycosyltransferase involved in cell wall biosynthesis